MSSRRLLAAITSIVLLSILVETSSGQIFFRRRRERLKAEMKWELQQQLNANLNSQVESARTDLADDASRQIQSEAAALRASLKSEIVAMRAEADKIVAAEKARIAKNAAQEIAKIKREADTKITSVKKELMTANSQSINNSIAAAEDTLKKALDNYSKALGTENKDAFVKFEKQTSSRFDSLKKEINSFIDTEVAAEVEKGIREQVAKSNAAFEKKIGKMIEEAMAGNKPEPPAPAEKKKPEGDKKAVLNRAPRISEEALSENDA